MPAPQQVFHLPKCPWSPDAYDRLYAFNHGADDYSEQAANWHERRLSPELSEVDVYRLLPNAGEFEFGGYLTKSSIRYQRCDSMRASLPMSKSCTFHSHPTNHELADVPSAEDVFQFLNFRHIRTVTVGKTRIWVWDKTPATMTTVEALSAWVATHMSTTVRKLQQQHSHAWHGPYVRLVLGELGLTLPQRPDDWYFRWPELIRSQLRVRVRIFSRKASQ